MNTIEARVGDWLDQRKPPRGLNETQVASLRADIISVVKKHQPATGVDAWLGEVLERIILSMRSGVWPGPQVWAMAVGAASQPKKEDQPAELSATEYSFRIFVKRMQEGGTVGEPELFGGLADRALRDGVISLDQLRQRQRSAFFARRALYGDGPAFDWLDRMQPQLSEELKRQRVAARGDVRLPHADDAEAIT